MRRAASEHGKLVAVLRVTVRPAGERRDGREAQRNLRAYALASRSALAGKPENLLARIGYWTAENPLSDGRAVVQ